MKVTFTKEHRRYAVLVEREQGSTLSSRGPGNDEWPHDLLHFVAESELGLDDGIFGSLAAGRPAKVFIPVDPKETVRPEGRKRHPPRDRRRPARR